MSKYKRLVTAACALLLSAIAGNTAMADISDVESTDRIASEASVAAGYRGTSVHGSPGRAREYDSLKSSPVFNGHLFTDTAPFHLDLGLDFRDEDDFSAEA
ncbi:MAG TPA: hypothetical protein VLL73_04270, partial [Desulfurivibrionaceae bacterium]|nr:hypothetical protein [Desulfurivibrionaceae bacterium]